VWNGLLKLSEAVIEESAARCRRSTFGLKQKPKTYSFINLGDPTAVLSPDFIVVAATDAGAIRGERIAELIDHERRGEGARRGDTARHRCVAMLGSRIQRSLLMEMRKGLALGTHLRALHVLRR
jgi:hypothetical protein